MQGRNGRTTYLRAIVAHLAGSVTSAAALGGALGWLGHSWLAPVITNWHWFGLSSVAAILAMREFGRIDFPIPQRSRQTVKTWYGRFGPVGAAWWWGIANAVGASPESSNVASRIVGCCSLVYSATCSSMSCFSGTNNWWAWTCCDGAFLYACYECYTHKCSKAVPQTCSPCRSSSALVSVGAPSVSSANC